MEWDVNNGILNIEIFDNYESINGIIVCLALKRRMRRSLLPFSWKNTLQPQIYSYDEIAIALP